MSTRLDWRSYVLSFMIPLRTLRILGGVEGAIQLNSIQWATGPTVDSPGRHRLLAPRSPFDPFEVSTSTASSTGAFSLTALYVVFRHSLLSSSHYLVSL